MNKAQKCAWFNLTLTLVIAALHGAAFLMIACRGYLPRTLNTIGFFVVFGLIGIGAVVFRRKQKFSEVEFDERDKLINKKVLVINYFFLWLVLIAGCVIFWYYLGPEGAVRVYALCVLLYGLFLVAMLFHSVTTLILYGSGKIKFGATTETGELS
jgi:amino acid transporter